MDKWSMTSEEIKRYASQFQQLNPVDGNISGETAKQFLMRSTLPPAVLCSIWELSDVNCDGKLNINEFAVACKLVQMKLKGTDVPQSLPPSLLQILNNQGIQKPIADVVNVTNIETNGITILSKPLVPPITSPPQQIPSVPTQPLIPLNPTPNVVPVRKDNIPSTALIEQTPAPLIPVHPVTVQPNVVIPPVVLSGQPPQPMVFQQPALPVKLPPAVITPPSTIGQSAVAPIPDLIGSNFVEPPLTSPPSSQEWAIPHQIKLKYTQLFNATDKSRTGFLDGLQARAIMVATQLPHAVLAEIWRLADIDSNGQLSSEEFVLAMYLCDLARAGGKIPVPLPQELVPPTFRRNRNNSLSGTGISDVSDSTLSLSQTSFEDKRKENFEKGQAELERRRKALLEIQRQEKEERERKEREEEEKREKIRLEQERRRQEELERELQKQREIEREKAEERRKAEELKEAARKEMEKKRQLEWEKKREAELLQEKQRDEQEILVLRNNVQSLTDEQKELTEVARTLSQKIGETRCAVTAIKSNIDTMRTTRDVQLSELNRLKILVKERNQRLIFLNQEKSKLDAKSKYNVTDEDKVNDEKMNIAIKEKQVIIQKLQEDIRHLKLQAEEKKKYLESNSNEIMNLKVRMKNVLYNCENLYSEYLDKKNKVLEVKATKLKEVSWGDDAWNAAPTTWPTTAYAEAAPDIMVNTYKRYRAIYEFIARNEDELSFQPGDIIMATSTPSTEPGWLAGELKGSKGWFPESYVECIDHLYSTTNGEANNVQPTSPDRALDEIVEVPENLSDSGSTTVEPVVETVEAVQEVQAVQASDVVGKSDVEIEEYYVALYPYQSEEPGDLCFQQNEVIKVVKKHGEWWSGVIDDGRTGIFPSNYVKPMDNKQINQSFISQSTIDTSSSKVPRCASAPPTQLASPKMENARAMTPDFSSAQDMQGVVRGKKPELATVIAPYQASSPEQLSLQRGQLIMIRKKTNSGWWEGEIQAKGKKRQIGWFPASYVKSLGGGNNTLSRRESRQSITSPSPLTERVIGLYKYTALNPDELSFEKDDIITVIAKVEPDWWKGELNGVVGLFPSNYVAPISKVNNSGFPIQEADKRQKYIEELITTEEVYIQDMSIVYEVFEKPLLESNILTSEEMNQIFVNWREIIVCNQMFLRALRVRRDMSTDGIIRMIGDVLCEHMPRMSAYVRFCSCQLSAAALLQRFTETRSDFQAIAKKCQSDPRTKGMPLSSFLIKPMQRITKYPLLIQKILEYTPVEHPDRQYLEEALSNAEEFCIQVNEGVREKENSDRLEWMQNHIQCEGLPERLIFNSLTNSLGARKLMHFGSFTKAKSGKELVGFLLNDMLLLARPLKALGGQFSFEKSSKTMFKIYRQPLMLNELIIPENHENDADNADLKLIHMGNPIILRVITQNERNLWLKKLNEAKLTLLAGEKYNLQRQRTKDAQYRARGRILITVVEGKNIKPPATGDRRAVYCEVSMGSQVNRTPTMASCEPKWNASMQFHLHDVNEDVLCITVLDKGHYSPDDFLGRTEVRASNILRATKKCPGPITKTLSLREAKSGEVTLKLDLCLFRNDYADE